MHTNSPRIVKCGLLMVGTLVGSSIVGCATSGDGAGLDSSASSLVVTPYRPIPTYRVPPPPTVHFWAPSGTGMIQAGLMNRLR